MTSLLLLCAPSLHAGWVKSVCSPGCLAAMETTSLLTSDLSSWGAGWVLTSVHLALCCKMGSCNVTTNMSTAEGARLKKNSIA